MKHPAPFVWLDERDTGRNQHAYFRFAFPLLAEVKSARFNLFADSAYHLYVNGHWLGTGPARGYPDYPQYDSYDLAPLLKQGDNVIGVHVLNDGVANFHHLLHRPGFCAWGELLLTRGGVLRFNTPGDWVGRRAEGYDRATAKFSFAQPPFQIFDERRDSPGWNLPDGSDEGWKPVTLLSEQAQASWGMLSPSSLPFLTAEEVLPASILGIHRHETDEVMHSFRLTQFSDPATHRLHGFTAFAYTYIHSPQAQKVPCSRYWGDHFLNGELLPESKEKRGIGGRIESILQLKEGWNLLFVRYGLVGDTWDFHLTIPKSAGLVFSPNRRKEEPGCFQTAGPFASESSIVTDLNPEAWDKAPPSFPGGWKNHPVAPAAVLPARGLAWARFSEEVKVESGSSEASNIRLAPHAPVSVIVDMGRKVLSRIFVEFEAPAGTIVDVGIAEELKDGRPFLDKNHLVFGADRHIASGGSSRMETFYPRGFRYLQVGVCNHNLPVTIRRIGIVTQQYPHMRVGHFKCSDPFFNDLWEAGWRTLLLCSEDVYTDCPWRERTLYTGDLLPEFATALVSSGDLTLVRRCVELSLQSQSPETRWQQSMLPMERQRAPLWEYPLLALLGARWIVRLSGDLTFASQCYATFQQLLSRAVEDRDPETGLYKHWSRPFIDHKGVCREGYSCPAHAILYSSFVAMAELAELLGHDADQKYFAHLAEETRIVTQEMFWDEEKQAFADCLIDGKLYEKHSAQANYWCLFHEVASEAQTDAVLRYLDSIWQEDAPVEQEALGGPYNAFYLLGALYMNNHEAFAEAFMKRAYGPMMEVDGDTIWEHFDPNKSLVHAWSTAPNYYLSSRALGVRLGYPDDTPSDIVSIAPQSETLEWAEGEVPHPRCGKIKVAWRLDGEYLNLDITMTKGIPCVVKPKGRLANYKLRVNGVDCPGNTYHFS